MTEISKPLVVVNNLKKYFKTKNGLLHAVDDVSFKINEGKTLGVVGESGCGKSTLGKTVLRLIEPTSGEVYIDGINVASLGKRDLRKARTKMQMIFQDPYSSLDQRLNVEELISDPIIVNHLYKSKKEIHDVVDQVMDIVGLAPRYKDSYPHELDGGRRQRIGIARVLALNPEFIVCDEPVSALDVSIQAQILNLMQDLQDSFGFSYLFITHDLSVVKHLSNEIMVMYLGKMVEKAKTEDLFRNPVHPYTQALLSAIPVPDPDFHSERILLQGEISSPIDPAPGCRFAARCPYATDRCRKGDIPLHEVEPGHFVACVLDTDENPGGQK